MVLTTGISVYGSASFYHRKMNNALVVLSKILATDIGNPLGSTCSTHKQLMINAPYKVTFI